MKRRPTRRAAVIVLIALLLFGAGATAQAGWLFVLSAGTLGFLVGSLFVARGLPASIVRTHPPTARVGDDVRVVLSVVNGSRGALPFMRVEDRHDAFEPLDALSERLRSGETGDIEAVRRVVRRGVFASGEVKLTTAAPLGFVRRARSIRVESGIIVAPRWVDLPSFPILEPSSSPTEQLHERARTGAGQEYVGVRDYRAGDPARWVHWRLSARRDQLVVREFEHEVSTPISILIAGKDTGEAPDSAFEAVVSAAASVALYALSTGHPVELYRPGPVGDIVHLSYPSKGQLLRWLAQTEPVDASPVAPAAEALKGGMKRGTIVVCTTTSGRALEGLAGATHAIQAAGSRAIVIAARSSTWAATPDADDEAVGLKALEGGRARVATASRGEDLRRCLLR
jgi:uncharacterized protein (DUF58 family)